MRTLLLLMVRDEAKVLRRCLDAAKPLVDAVVVVDTGSADDTQEIAAEYGEVFSIPWKDFGECRTKSLELAKEWATHQNWDLATSYALLLDADHVVHGDLDLQGAPGYRLRQRNEDLEYWNVRLVRLDLPWRCEGATHEVWVCENEESEEMRGAWIQDLNDGGCRSQKFQRDRALLQDKTDPRSIFYLANTLRALGETQAAIQTYKRRIAIGGWFEERYVCHQNLVEIFVNGDLPLAELHAQRALAVDEERAEATMTLVQALRAKGDFHKAWHYLATVKPEHRIQNKLFLRPTAYDEERLFETVCVAFYVGQQEAGMDACIQYQGMRQETVLCNLVHYCRRLDIDWKRLEIPCEEGFKNSSIAISGNQLCIRTVNYEIIGGCYTQPPRILTRNFTATWNEASETVTDMTEIHPEMKPQFPKSYIGGIEDIRIYGKSWTATTQEYSYEAGINRIVAGNEFPKLVFQCLKPPFGDACQKNWLPLGQDLFVYCWHPFTIIKALPSEDYVRETVPIQITPTPPFFRHLRGSTPLFEWGGEIWAIAHLVAKHQETDYLHLFVRFSEKLEPIGFTEPALLFGTGIQYVIGAQECPTGLRIFASYFDRESLTGVLKEKPVTKWNVFNSDSPA